MDANAPTDQGPNPFVTDIEKATLENENYRTTLWTGAHLQLTLMSIQPGHDIGLEVHSHGDQFLRVERGTGLVEMGPTEDDLTFRQEAHDDDVILIPAGTWHNVTNTGDEPLKVYALYGPPDHEPGTEHPTHEDAEEDPAED